MMSPFNNVVRMWLFLCIFAVWNVRESSSSNPRPCHGRPQAECTPPCEWLAPNPRYGFRCLDGGEIPAAHTAQDNYLFAGSYQYDGMNDVLRHSLRATRCMISNSILCHTFCEIPL